MTMLLFLGCVLASLWTAELSINKHLAHLVLCTALGTPHLSWAGWMHLSSPHVSRISSPCCSHFSWWEKPPG